jgi:hypothetical protein
MQPFEIVITAIILYILYSVVKNTDNDGKSRKH